MTVGNDYAQVNRRRKHRVNQADVSVQIILPSWKALPLEERWRGSLIKSGMSNDVKVVEFDSVDSNPGEKMRSL